MSGLTKSRRQEIVREFALRHNGVFNPKLFLEDVRRRGKDHPAYDWFTWDAGDAALRWQIEEARQFARDLRVTFTVETVGRGSPVKVVERMPMVLSPVSGRRDGGGYVLTRPEEPTHMEEHCRQAASALRAWIERYSAAVKHAGGSTEGLTALSHLLDAAASKEQQAA